MERRYRNISGIDGVKTVMTYNEAFPLWVAEVYRNHGYEPDTWYGSEVAEKMHKEALATYKGPPATMLDYVEAIPSEEEFEYLDYAIQQLRKDNINLNALPDKERWAVMDRIIAEYAEHKNTHTSRAKQVQDSVSTPTRTERIRAMDKFHLGVLLNDIRHEPQKYPECHMAWIDWLNGQPKGTIIGKNF